MVEYLKTHEAALWDWFSSDRLRTQQNEAARLDLLKCTYRIDRASNDKLYTLADEVCSKLGVAAPVTFYQSQDAGRLNVSLVYMPGETHVVLVGPIATTLTDSELRCVLGHELLHFGLLECWRDYLTASQILSAMTNDVAASPSHVASARLFGLYTEVYCDRGSYLASGDLAATITALAKIETGVTDVSAESYLRQTEEIFSKGHPVTGGITHPEMFIRAKAIQLWTDQPDLVAKEIPRIIEGPLTLEALDLLGQLKMSDLTKRLAAQALKPPWMRTEATMAHARLFFEDFRPAAAEDPSLAADLKSEDAKTVDYYCYLLLDFAVADRDLEEAPLAAALLMSDELGLGERFRQLAAKELNLRKKQMEALEADAGRIVAQAREAGEAS
jgi:hypothetical protein